MTNSKQQAEIRSNLHKRIAFLEEQNRLLKQEVDWLRKSRQVWVERWKRTKRRLQARVGNRAA